MESNEVHLHFLHEECWLGQRSHILDLSFVSAVVPACAAMAIMSAAQGGRGIYLTYSDGGLGHRRYRRLKVLRISVLIPLSQNHMDIYRCLL